jgi:hypothetical protein
VNDARSLNVFVSYARHDSAHVKSLRGLLRGIIPESSVFVDTESLRVGEKWESQLREAIDGCDVFVVAWSWRARASEWVERETLLAVAQAEATGRPRIVPVLLDRTALSTVLAPFQAVHARVADFAGSSRLEPVVIGTCVIALLSSVVWMHASKWQNGILLLGVVALWTAVTAFWALRAGRAPWTDPDAKSGLLLGVVRLQFRSLSALFVGSALAALLAFGLNFFSN